MFMSAQKVTKNENKEDRYRAFRNLKRDSDNFKKLSAQAQILSFSYEKYKQHILCNPLHTIHLSNENLLPLTAGGS